MKKVLSIILAAVLAVSMITVFAACSKTPESKDEPNGGTDAGTTVAAVIDDVAKIQEKGTLVIGITDFEPMDYKDENGEWIGFDADMAKAFAESLGVKAEFVEIDWDNKVLELNNGSIDCVWNGMTLTDEVTSTMDCSAPYCNNAQVVVVNKSVADKYVIAEDCMDLSFAVESGSAGQEQAEAHGFTYTEVKDQATALMEVASGNSDAAIIDLLMAAAMIGDGTAYADLTSTAPLNSEEYGVGFRQGSNLVAKFADFYAAAKADGSLEKCAIEYGVQAALID